MSNNLNTVTRIGAGARLTETAAPVIAATAPAGFDPAKRGAVALPRRQRPAREDRSQGQPARHGLRPGR
jgi:hypothetical protein